MKPFMILVLTLLMTMASAVADMSARPLVQLLSGEHVVVEGDRERPLYLKFWASWCGTCLAQMPHLQSIHETHREAIDVIAVNFGLNDTHQLLLGSPAKRN